MGMGPRNNKLLLPITLLTLTAAQQPHSVAAQSRAAQHGADLLSALTVLEQRGRSAEVSSRPAAAQCPHSAHRDAIRAAQDRALDLERQLQDLRDENSVRKPGSLRDAACPHSLAADGRRATAGTCHRGCGAVAEVAGAGAITRSPRQDQSATATASSPSSNL